MSASHSAWLVCLVLCTLTAAAFRDVVTHEFVDYDDTQYILDSPIVNEGLSARSVRLAFTTVHNNNWHPMASLSQALDVSVFGLDAGRHHLVSLILHAANACLLFLVLLRLCPGAVGESAVVAALFALHPAHVESVVWASQRKDLLSTLCMLLAVAAWASWARYPTQRRYAVVCTLLALGLMAKPMLVTLPFVLLLLDFWPLGRFERVRPTRLVAEKIPLFALVAASAIVTFLAQRSGGAVQSLELVPLGERVANAIVAYARYLGLLFWPLDLACFYPRLQSLPLWQIVGAAGLLTAITGAAVALRRRHPYVLVGWLWFVGTLVPVIGIVQVGDQSLADRYTYVPFIGLFVAGVFGVARAVPAATWRAPVLGVLATGALVGCFALTVRQVPVWRDSETLWRHALAVTADNATAHHHLGNTLVTLGRHDEALEHLTRAVVLRPEAAVLRFNHGVALAEAGRPGAGRAELERAVELSPDLWEAKVVLANFVRRDGDASRALALFEEGLSGRPALWQMPNLAKSYALALRAYGRAPGRTLEEALAVYRAALVLRPDWLEVSTELAWILATHPEATPEHGAEAVELASAAARATDDRSYFELDKLAAAYAAAGRFDEAIEVGERALALARAAGSAVALRRLGERLALYRAGERFREEP